MRRYFSFGLAALLALVGGIAAYSWLDRAANASEKSPALLAIRLNDLSGKSVTVNDWDGKIRVVNFWATWCAPCKKEIPGFIALQNKLGSNRVQIIGIAVDNEDKVQQFATEIKFNYPILIGGFAATSILEALGNPSGGLPFTVVLDPKGNIVTKVTGPLTTEALEQLILATEK